MATHQHFERNNDGTDYVVGDIHGCFGMLRSALAALNFDESKDRLFSVGDLVDRGPESIEATEWIQKPWFHAIRGNHEEFCISVAEEPDNLALRSCHFDNGGAWFTSLSHGEQFVIAAEFLMLPLLISIDTPHGRIGLVHGDVPGNDWDNVVEHCGSNEYVRHRALWGRDRIKRRDLTVVENIYMVYCGHTVVKEPCELGNVRYIDTGACFGHGMTLVNLHTEELIEFR